jgi:hypothetical protein
LVVSICPYFFFVFGFMRLGLAVILGFGFGVRPPGEPLGAVGRAVGLAFGLIFVGCLVAVGLVYPIPGRITS